MLCYNRGTRDLGGASLKQFENWDFVTWGRVAGVVIIVVGFALAAWDVIETEDDFGLGKARLSHVPDPSPFMASSRRDSSYWSQR